MCAEWSIWGCTVSLRLRCIWGKMLTGPKEEEEEEEELDKHFTSTFTFTFIQV
jgi:hypothetical protein